MNCGDIEENPRVLDQCYSNNNFGTNAVLDVRSSGVLLETRLQQQQQQQQQLLLFLTLIHTINEIYIQ